MTVADVIRDRARRLGCDLSHVPDFELGSRLAAMPLAVSDDGRLALTWLAYGDTDPHAPLPEVPRPSGALRGKRRRA